MPVLLLKKPEKPDRSLNPRSKAISFIDLLELISCILISRINSLLMIDEAVLSKYLLQMILR